MFFVGVASDLTLVLAWEARARDVSSHFLSSTSGRVQSAQLLLLDKQYVQLGATRISSPVVGSGLFSGHMAG